jgi:hypothetical protein
VKPSTRRTRPFSATHSETGTPQRSAAAATSITRAVAPAVRICSKDDQVLVEPPVPWTM